VAVQIVDVLDETWFEIVKEGGKSCMKEYVMIDDYAQAMELVRKMEAHLPIPA
jgi:hypothetical protein